LNWKQATVVGQKAGKEKKRRKKEKKIKKPKTLKLVQSFKILISWHARAIVSTLRQSKKASIILQNFAVATASGGPNSFNTAATEALSTCAARLTLITE